jgi:hypothetical protein
LYNFRTVVHSLASQAKSADGIGEEGGSALMLAGSPVLALAL